MKIKVQFCYCGNDVFKFRALVCGGLLVRADKWTRNELTGKDSPERYSSRTTGQTTAQVIHGVLSDQPGNAT